MTPYAVDHRATARRVPGGTPRDKCAVGSSICHARILPANHAMSDTASDRLDVSCIVLHEAEPLVLLVWADAGWRLPAVTLAERSAERAASRLPAVLREQWGIDAVVLRRAHARRHPDRRRWIDLVYTLESHGAATLPPGCARWAGRADLDALVARFPEECVVTEASLVEAETGAVPSLRSPWARRGWFNAASTWIETRLHERGFALVGPIEQVRTWPLSSVLRARTTAGDVYFKASALPTHDDEGHLRLLFTNEARLTETLWSREPAHIPAPLAIDAERSWMLTADFGPPLRGNSTVDQWEEMLDIYGGIQFRATTQDVDLHAAGCLDRRLEHLAAAIDPTLDDAAVLAGLDADAVSRLHDSASLLREICERLATSRIPPALVHGDLHAGNVAAGSGTYVFFDWTDACVSHPFIDLVTVWAELPSVDGTPEARARLRDRYLAHWQAFETRERLLEEAALAEAAGALHQMVSYRHIIANVEPGSPSEVVGGLSFWRDILLATLERGQRAPS